MAAGNNPIFVATPKTWHGQVTTLNAARDGSGTLATIATGAANGSLITMVRVVAIVTTTAGMVRLFLSLNGGTNDYLLKEIAVSANTVSASNPAVEYEWVPTVPINLPDTNAVLTASTETGEDFNVFAIGGDY